MRNVSERVLPAHDQGTVVAESAAAAVARYHAACCTLVDEKDGRRGFNG